MARSRKGVKDIRTELLDKLLFNVREQRAILQHIEEARTTGCIGIKAMGQLIDQIEQLQEDRQQMIVALEVELLAL
ncbi:hypothetical protein [Paenibacillus sp. GXUN7292]|uniref:hypothetical protein n=1 Tax=Paenibacillus sp. GXUN7292 TaxID=3422499 RepID=UPI003D7DC953